MFVRHRLELLDGLFADFPHLVEGYLYNRCPNCAWMLGVEEMLNEKTCKLQFEVTCRLSWAPGNIADFERHTPNYDLCMECFIEDFAKEYFFLLGSSICVSFNAELIIPAKWKTGWDNYAGCFLFVPVEGEPNVEVDVCTGIARESGNRCLCISYAHE